MSAPSPISANAEGPPQRQLTPGEVDPRRRRSDARSERQRSLSDGGNRQLDCRRAVPRARSSSTAAEGCPSCRGRAVIRPAPAPTETSSAARGAARGPALVYVVRFGRRERGRRERGCSGSAQVAISRLCSACAVSSRTSRIFVQAPARQRRPRRCVNEADFDLRLRPRGRRRRRRPPGGCRRNRRGARAASWPPPAPGWAGGGAAHVDCRRCDRSGGRGRQRDGDRQNSDLPHHHGRQH